MFEKIDNKFRPIPFWSWNEKLDVEETKRQIRLMGDAGIGGFFMHARGGLQTEYMGDEWFENVAAGIDEAENREMKAWAYDENGWPSGFGNGIVNGAGIEFQQKYLRFEDALKEEENTICNYNGVHFYYDVNPFYVDTLNPSATKLFLEKIYQPYYDKFKNRIEGFFTDEPQISRDGIPWSFLIPDAYRREYGENLLEHLIELFKPIDDYESTRFKFWRLVTKMFSENFMKPIYEWCDERGLKITGHFVSEESLESQLTTNGAVMPHYEYLHMPGMDWLGRPIYRCLTPLQVTSVAHQLGRRQILSETFALCGHNVSFEELKGIYEWQMVNGITQLCQHLEGYSLRGIRKRDYPPAMFYQQPWWNDYKIFNDAMSRVGMVLSEGKVEYDTLLIHPQSSAWVCFDNDKNEGLKELDDALLEVMKTLEQKHILYHLGDETIMERHAKAEDGCLVIGTQRYKTVVLPPHKVLFDTTRELLKQFEAEGGKIVTADEIEENPIVSSPYISYTKRYFDGFDVYYFVNSTNENHSVKINVGSKVMDIKTGEFYPFGGEYTFNAYESLLLIDDNSKCMPLPEEKDLTPLSLDGRWNIKNITPNAITLDKCDYYFDGELVEENGYVLNIQQRACALKKPVDIRCEYKINVEYIPKSLHLVCETPEIFDISVNGQKLDIKTDGYFVDSSFKKIEISEYIKDGVNSIILSTEFSQSEKVYKTAANMKAFENERNKLTYDMEIEPIYLVGDFGVKCNEGFENLERDVYRYNGDFSITKRENSIYLSNIEQQGFPFFAGSITLEKELELENIDYKFSFKKSGINVVKIKVNDSPEQVILWEPLEADISKYLKKGKNKIEITLCNNLRNLLGPHHLEEGECRKVCPFHFYKEPAIWSRGDQPPKWNDGYCFVKTSLI